MLFTTSWDDGHPSDLHVADLLERYGMKGTFYLCKAGQAGATLSSGEIRLLATRHEVGAHTLTHPHLPLCDGQTLTDEIDGSKRWVESVTGKPCELFAYPYGHVSSQARGAVKAAGYLGARTTEDLSWDSSDPFLMPTTLQLHYFPLRPIANRRCIEPIRMLWSKIRRAGIPLVACRSWLPFAIAAFEHARTERLPWFHLWGHSWSVERYRFSTVLGKFLDYVSVQPDVRFVTNGELRHEMYGSGIAH